MPVEPAIKRAIVFFDGQNLFHAAKDCFGYTFPNYEPILLAEAVCKTQGWTLAGVRFYTGVPDARDDARWQHFWFEKLNHLKRRGAFVFSRTLRYRNKQVKLPDGSTHSFLAAEEKGVDVRIAIDIIRLGHGRDYDIAVVFSQDQDLSEVASEIRVIASEQGRWIKLASAFPWSLTSSNARGINKTDWIRVERAVYDACIDPRDYRPKSPPNGP
ncbi:MAG: NYN domain-containing protein [Planctomycetes bacterium]|nr:NYN domain-containing protein [Planctomycetota bacterium]